MVASRSFKPMGASSILGTRHQFNAPVAQRKEHSASIGQAES